MSFLELNNICASYDDSHMSLPGSETVLNHVSFSLEKGRIMGLVGESGSGKSTIARVITGLLPASGQVFLDGKQIAGTDESGRLIRRRKSKEESRKIQMVFQNPEGSLNPKHTIGKILCDCITFHGLEGRAGAKALAQDLIERMELPADTLSRYPSSFSGGQKQRIALARALCVEPDLLIADEPTSALDVSVQMSMLKLMKELSRERGLTMLFISHDLGVVNYLCDDITVLKDGKIVENTSAEEFFTEPETEYGRNLLEAVPILNMAEGE